MSTSPALETTKPGEGPPSVSQAEQNSSIEKKVITTEQNEQLEPKVSSAEQSILIEPKLAPPGDHTIVETEVTSSEEQKPPVQKVGDQNIFTEQKVIHEICNSEENSTVVDQKLSEVVKNGKEFEKETAEGKVEIAEDTSAIGNKPEVKNPGQEPAAGSVAKEKNDTKTEDTKMTSELEKHTNAAEPVLVNGQDCKQSEQESNPEQNADVDTSECVNIQELTEHVMNILNDDVVDEVLTEQQLVKKNVDLQQFIVKLIQLLKEKTDLCANLDRQNSALISQAQSLKDVIAITKDLLGIRNMEIEHLHADLAAMEETIKEERTRYNTSVQRLNEAMSLNDKLKTEYLTQMDLFQKLRDKYNEKVVFLTRENLRLNSLLNPDCQPAEAIADETTASDLESSQTESVDK